MGGGGGGGGLYLAVYHVGDHHDGVTGRVGELEREFGSLDVIRQNHRLLHGNGGTEE